MKCIAAPIPQLKCHKFNNNNNNNNKNNSFTKGFSYSQEIVPDCLQKKNHLDLFFFNLFQFLFQIEIEIGTLCLWKCDVLSASFHSKEDYKTYIARSRWYKCNKIFIKRVLCECLHTKMQYSILSVFQLCKKGQISFEFDMGNWTLISQKIAVVFILKLDPYNDVRTCVPSSILLFAIIGNCWWFNFHVYDLRISF